MSVVNFQVEVTPEKKDVALKAMALIAAMAEITMRDLATCVEGIEVVDPEEVKGPSGVAAPLKKAEEVEDEKPKRRRKKTSKKQEEKPAEEKTQEKKKPYGDDRKDSVVDKYEAEKEAEKKSEEKKTEKKADSDVTIEQVRAKLQEVVKDHREEIVAKLKELGGTAVSNLPKDKYGDMYEFLNSLD